MERAIPGLFVLSWVVLGAMTRDWASCPPNFSIKNGAGYSYWHFSYLDDLTRSELLCTCLQLVCDAKEPRLPDSKDLVDLFSFEQTFVQNQKSHRHRCFGFWLRIERPILPSTFILTPV